MDFPHAQPVKSFGFKNIVSDRMKIVFAKRNSSAGSVLDASDRATAGLTSAAPYAWRNLRSNQGE